MSPNAPAKPQPYANENYLADTEYVVKVAKTLLTPIGIWPRSGDFSSTSRSIFYIRVCLVFCLMLFLLAPHFIWTWFKAEDLRKLMKIIAAQVFSSLAVLKFWSLILNKPAIRYCLEVMEDDYRVAESEEDRQIMIKNAKIGRFFTTAYLGLSYGGALPYHIIMPLLQERVVKSDNTTMIPLPYPSEYVFFIVEDSPLYEIVFVTQILISSIILSTNTGVYSLIACTVMHSCCLFEVTSNQFATLLRDKDVANNGLDSGFAQRISKVIDFHGKAIKYAETIENALNIVMLSEMGGCTLIICFLEYGILQDLEDGDYLGMVTYCVLMTSIFVNVFILSFVGDKVKEQSERIGFSTYSLEWYYLPNDVVLKDLKFVMARAHQPTRLTAGKLFDLSLQGFCDVAKTSMAYLNFLRTLEITTSCIMFLAIFFIPHGSYVFLVEPDREVRLKMIGPLCKYTFAVLNRCNIAVCVHHMAEDWLSVREADERLLMLQVGHWSEVFTKLCVIFLYTGALSYAILLPLIQEAVAFLSPNSTRLLIFPIHVGSLTVDVATDHELLFHVIFFVLSISGVVICTVTVGIDIFMVKLVLHAYGQINILKKYLRSIDGEKKNEDRSRSSLEYFKIVVVKHLRILRFIKMIDKSLTGICFAECFGSSYAICLIGFYILKEYEKHQVLNVITYSCLLISFVSSIFVFCFVGDRLTDQCRKIGVWTYEVNWSNLIARGESSIDMRTIILMSQNPPKLTAGKIFFLTMESFTSIMKAAVAYLNLLRKLM